jgi:hypothetical protein
MKPIDINYFAVVAAAVATFFLGWLWYSPVLLARQWMKAHGHTSEKLEQMKKNMAQALGVSAACNFVAAVVLAVLTSWTGSITLLAGAALGVIAWVGFAAATGLTANMLSEKATRRLRHRRRLPALLSPDDGRNPGGVALNQAGHRGRRRHLPFAGIGFVAGLDICLPITVVDHDCQGLL